MEDLSGLLKEYFSYDEDGSHDVYESFFQNIYNSYFNEESFITNRFYESLYGGEKNGGQGGIQREIYKYIADGGADGALWEKIDPHDFSGGLREYFRAGDEKIYNNAFASPAEVLRGEGIRLPFEADEDRLYGKSGGEKRYGIYAPERGGEYDEKPHGDAHGVFLENSLSEMDGKIFNHYNEKAFFYGDSDGNFTGNFSGNFPGAHGGEGSGVGYGAFSDIYAARDTSGSTGASENTENLLSGFFNSGGEDHRSFTNNINPTVNLYSSGEAAEIDAEEIADKIADLIAEAVSREANGFYG